MSALGTALGTDIGRLDTLDDGEEEPEREESGNPADDLIRVPDADRSRESRARRIDLEANQR